MCSKSECTSIRYLELWEIDSRISPDFDILLSIKRAQELETNYCIDVLQVVLEPNVQAIILVQ